jgi:arginyl-tRNA synthetase
MIEIKKRIEDNLIDIVKDMGINNTEVLVNETVDLTHGDLTSNIAMQVAKELKSNPRELASKIVSMFPTDDDIEKVEVAGPGFINFYLSNKYLMGVVSDISKNSDEYFKLDNHSGKKFVIEYTDPNPFKTLHIGHLYTNMVGESFARLVEALGGSVTRAIYQGDVGLHVAKTLFGLNLLLKRDNIKFDDLKEKSLVDRVNYLGEAYMYGFNQYDDVKDENAIEGVKNLNYYIFSIYIPTLEKKGYFKEYEYLGIKEMYLEGKQWCMEYFEKIYERTYTKFDKYYLESEMGAKGLETVIENTDSKGKGVFETDDGAIIYRGDEKKGLHTRVFVNKEGLPTYEAKEIALALKKFEEIPFDESVIITADEQSSYFKVVLDAISQLEPEVANRTKHFSHGMIKLPGAEKMSSRKGKIIEGEWLLNETRSRVLDIMKSSGKWNEKEVEDITDAISVSAIKYAFLKVTVGKDVIFDFDKSISFDGDTGPYLQYVYARCNSILRDSNVVDGKNGTAELDAHTKELLQTIGKYKSVLLSSSTSYSPSTLCSYLFDLGQSFNKFYQNVRVLDSENKEFLLTVVDATAKTMKHGLNVLGIRVVEKM